MPASYEVALISFLAPIASRKLRPFKSVGDITLSWIPLDHLLTNYLAALKKYLLGLQIRLWPKRSYI